MNTARTDNRTPVERLRAEFDAIASLVRQLRRSGKRDEAWWWIGLGQRTKDHLRVQEARESERTAA